MVFKLSAPFLRNCLTLILLSASCVSNFWDLDLITYYKEHMWSLWQALPKQIF